MSGPVASPPQRWNPERWLIPALLERHLIGIRERSNCRHMPRDRLQDLSSDFSFPESNQGLHCARYRAPLDNHDVHIRVTICSIIIIRCLRAQEGEEGREGTPLLDSRTLAIAATVLRLRGRHRCHDIVAETFKYLPSRGSCFADQIEVYSRVLVFLWASMP